MKHLVAAAATVLLTAAGLATAVSASAATTGCSVTYTVVSQWQGGFQGGVSFTNLGDPLAGWTLEFTFPDAAQKITQGWNATWSQSGTAVTAVGMSWNSSVPTNGSLSLGFIGSWSGSNPKPASFKINGVTCTGGTTTPPTTSPTTP